MDGGCFDKIDALKHAGLEEILCSPRFWILGLLVTLNARWVREQFDLNLDLQRRAKFNSFQSREAAELLARPLPIHYFWLQPLITSPGRKFLAMLVCHAFLALQSLELIWVYQAAWRLSVALFNSQCEDRGSSPLTICIPVMGGILVVLLYLWRTSMAWTFTQISYIFQLYRVPTEHPTDLTSVYGGPPPDPSPTNPSEPEKSTE